MDRQRATSQIAAPPYMDGGEPGATRWVLRTRYALDRRLGVLIQGLALKHLNGHLQEVLLVEGCTLSAGLYSVNPEGVGRHVPMNDSCISIQRRRLCTLLKTNPPSVLIVFRSFEELETIASQHASVVDVVGRLVSATPITYYQKQDRSIKRQVVVIENEREVSLSITLWSNFAERLNLPELIELNGAAPVIVAFTTYSKTYNMHPVSFGVGIVGASSTSATRIVLSPAARNTARLTAHFGDAVAAIGVVPTELDTPEKAATVYRQSFKTITELQTIQSTATMGGKFRCRGKITDLDTSRDWCYLGCATCSKAAVRCDAPYWCAKCDATVHPHQLKQCFRVRFMVHEGSAYAPFIMIGQAAETVLKVSAGTLLATAPDRTSFRPDR
ncbi:unnamed protein product [Linum trigynum]|uniref:Replication protein A OB domain-containing protein n=1 Tax=Linum trigynum TaxID=586398 RepID=A0AAV2GMG2_9ROSI